VKSGSYDLSFDANLSTSDSLKITTGNLLEKLTIIFDKKAGTVTINRSQSGLINFSNFFKENINCSSLNLGADQKLDIRMLVDKTSVELFWNHGENTMTVLFFPAYQYNYLKLDGNTTSPFISNFVLTGLSKSLQR
jgi:levanase/fructan beta-fructosidase